MDRDGPVGEPERGRNRWSGRGGGRGEDWCHDDEVDDDELDEEAVPEEAVEPDPEPEPEDPEDDELLLDEPPADELLPELLSERLSVR